MRYLSPSFILLVLTLCIQCPGWAQVPKNIVKVDLLGPPTALVTTYPREQWRISFEYERRLLETIPLSAILDFEFGYRQYQFERLFVWPDSYDLSPEWWPGFATQRNLTAIIGLRYASRSTILPEKRWNWFIEPRMEVSRRQAELAPDVIFRPVLVTHEYGVAPRLRAGGGVKMGKRIGLEASADLYQYVFLGNGRRTWSAIAELNVTYRF
jgi:hypothetical protein